MRGGRGVRCNENCVRFVAYVHERKAKRRRERERELQWKERTCKLYGLYFDEHESGG